MKFSGVAQSVIATYDAQLEANKSAEFWNEESVNDVRREAKQHYITEQRYRCCYCDVELLSMHGRVWDVEHVVPRATHPRFMFEPKNLAVSCVDCNGAKSDKQVLVRNGAKRYPKRSSAFLICHPHYDNLKDHVGILFERLYFPKTAKGEATVVTCGLLKRAYRFVSWDDGIADNDRLRDAFGRAMNSADDKEMTLAMMEALVVAHLRVVR